MLSVFRDSNTQKMYMTLSKQDKTGDETKFNFSFTLSAMDA